MQSKILNELKIKAGQFVSGRELSDALDISRQAISKHIKKLKEEGYHIESVSRKGHRLITDHDPIYSANELQSENKTSIGKKLVFLETVGSTNDYAKSIAFDSPDKTVVIADEQSGGKGRLGRKWSSEKGSGIWMSVILKPDILPSDAPKITQIAGAAMTEAIRQITDLDVKIKWPNDLIVNKRKLCGVLTEMSAELGGINYVVVGIGVNVNQTEFPEELADKATSIRMNSQVLFSRKDIVIKFFEEFETLYDDFINSRNLKKTIEICKRQSLLLNEQVRLITKKETRTVTVKDINEQGELLVLNEKEELEAVFYGEVSIRGLYDYVD